MLMINAKVGDVFLFAVSEKGSETGTFYIIHTSYSYFVCIFETSLINIVKCVKNIKDIYRESYQTAIYLLTSLERLSNWVVVPANLVSLIRTYVQDDHRRFQNCFRKSENTT